MGHIDFLSSTLDFAALFLVAKLCEFKVTKPLMWLVCWALSFDVLLLDTVVLFPKIRRAFTATESKLMSLGSLTFHVIGIIITVLDLITINTMITTPIMDLPKNVANVIDKITSTEGYTCICAILVAMKFTLAYVRFRFGAT